MAKDSYHSSDIAIAEIILQVAKSSADRSHLPSWVGGPDRRAMREMIWSGWQLPRLPRPLFRNKYPKSAPWSPKAREFYYAHNGNPPADGTLQFEHVIPMTHLSRELIRNAHTLTAEDVIELLCKHELYAVITKSEDRLLKRAVLPDSDDPWSRYRQAGFDLDDFSDVLDDDDDVDDVL